MADFSEMSPVDADPASSVPDSVEADERVDEDPAAPELADVPEAHREPLRRLYRRVEQAVGTIEQLREENKRLRRRVRELEARPELPEGKALLALDDDPEALQDRIADFIDAIDTYLDATDPERDLPDAEADDRAHPDAN